ncbi:MAG: response regulator transcription factor, partial [Thermoplasmata archaeon]
MKTIMIVDEDRDIVERIKSYLEKEDFNVSVAQTNREALEALEKNEQN